MRGYRKAAFAFYPHECTLCGATPSADDPLVVHHRDLDHGNAAMTNLQIVCRACHKQLHAKKPRDVPRDPGTNFVIRANPALRRFARAQAANLFGGRVSPYIVCLLELDRDGDVVRKELIRRLTDRVDAQEAIPA
jgi:hypothetical protein